MFVDYLSIYQSHPEQLPILNNGVIQGVDGDGQLVWQLNRGFKLEGSFESSVLINCDGHTVKFSGNPSRFNRPDNVFGFDLCVCIRRINQILKKLNLPPFTAGQRFLRPSKKKNYNFASDIISLADFKQKSVIGNIRREKLNKWSNESIVDIEYTGARVTRIDLTKNYFLGGEENARKYLQWLFTQQPSRQAKVGTYPDNSTVDWGRGSRRKYAKFYLKFIEMLRHKKQAPDERLINWAAENGLGRFELSLKSKLLSDLNCQFLGNMDMNALEEYFDQQTSILTRAELSLDDLDKLPNALRLTARDYLAGEDMSKLPKSTFCRKRKELLRYGIDISVPRNVYQFQPKIKVIELQPATMPDFYKLVA